MLMHTSFSMCASISKLVFAAQQNVSYNLGPDRTTLGFVENERLSLANPPLTWTPAIWLHTSRGVRIPAAFLKRKDASQTILFSHGNAEDLGHSLQYAEMLRSRLNVNVFVYEYSGYSHSEYIKPNKPSVAVKPSEDNLYADIEAAYQYLTNQHIHPRNIIVFGRSLGSGPSCHLAARHNVGGLVLISALTSILRVPLPWLRITIPGDMFVNIDKMKHIRCPVLCVHGMQDQVTPFKHAQALFKAAPAKSFAPYWHPKAGHNDLELLDWDTVCLYYEDFLSALQTNQLPYADVAPISERRWKERLQKILLKPLTRCRNE